LEITDTSVKVKRTDVAFLRPHDREVFDKIVDIFQVYRRLGLDMLFHCSLDALQHSTVGSCARILVFADQRGQRRGTTLRRGSGIIWAHLVSVRRSAANA
jgi:hypothetical protein